MPSNTEAHSSSKGVFTRSRHATGVQAASTTTVPPSMSLTPLNSKLASASASLGYLDHSARYQRADSPPPHDPSHHDRIAIMQPSGAMTMPVRSFISQAQPNHHHASIRNARTSGETTLSHLERSELAGTYSFTPQVSGLPDQSISSHTSNWAQSNSPALSQSHRRGAPLPSVLTKTTRDQPFSGFNLSSTNYLPPKTIPQQHRATRAPVTSSRSSSPSSLIDINDLHLYERPAVAPPDSALPSVDRRQLPPAPHFYSPHSPPPTSPSSSAASPTSSVTEIPTISGQRQKQRGRRSKDRRQSKLNNTQDAPQETLMPSVNLFMPGYSISFAPHSRSATEHSHGPPRRMSPPANIVAPRSPRSPSSESSGSWRRPEAILENSPPILSSGRSIHSKIPLIPPRSDDAMPHVNRGGFLGISFRRKKVQTAIVQTSVVGQSSQAKNEQRACYPSKSYDAILLDHDRRTAELLRRINSNASPSFQDYGNVPPSSILDLGCGQGHWLLEAATSWRRNGTKVTGFDMVDVMKDLWPLAVKQGVADSIRFIQGNFLTKALPFPDKSFDLVRMANLTLCIPRDKWEPVLREVRRVLKVGGRLELIDDQILFPYGKVPTQGVSYPPASYQKPDGIAHAATQTRPPFSLTSPSPLHSKDDPKWAQRAATSKELEDRFTHMLLEEFGISIRPSEFVPDLLVRTFGQAREVGTMRLMLASPDAGAHHGGVYRRADKNLIREPRGPPGQSPNLLTQSPGLVLWPSTFIPVPSAELEVHATKHPCILLATEDLLIEHALKGRSSVHGRNPQAALVESLRKYEGFIRNRFDPPQDVTAFRHPITHLTGPLASSLPFGTDLTHVRTFHVYVATKMNTGAHGSP